MRQEDKQSHWQRVYETKSATEVSWYQPEPRVSLELIDNTGVSRDASILDVGGGASTLIDGLLAKGYRRLGVLDIAEAALAASKQRLGKAADEVEWFVSDVRDFQSPHLWDLWHDRAVFHFLTEAADRRAYRDVLLSSVPPGGQVIMATFALSGPEKCSGLEVVRYDAAGLLRELGDGVALEETRQESHHTPGGKVQDFLYCRFRRV